MVRTDMHSDNSGYFQILAQIRLVLPFRKATWPAYHRRYFSVFSFSLLYLSILYNIGDPGRRKLTNEKLNPIIKYTTNYTHTHIEGYVGSDEGYWQRVWCGGGGGGKMVW